MSSIRVVFMGTPSFAVPSLETLLNQPLQYDVVGVFTQPDKPQGRGQKTCFSPVKERALQASVPVFQPTSLRTPETYALLQQLQPQLIVVAAYGKILPLPVLNLPVYGCLNVHASLLPQYRGASPIAHAILHGDTHTGVAIMRMEEGLDTGPVYATQSVAIKPTDTTESLTHILAQLGALLLTQTLPNIVLGDAQPEPQPQQGASYAPLLHKNKGLIDFTQTAVEIERHIRAMFAWPMAFCHWKDLRFQVVQAAVSPHAAPLHAPPGSLLSPKTLLGGIEVVCGNQTVLEILKVKPAGKQTMLAAAWCQGHKLVLGEIFK
jgi:methionyl-tRNA formyltransferase